MHSIEHLGHMVNLHLTWKSDLLPTLQVESLATNYPLPFSISLQSTVFVLSLGSSQPVQTIGKVPLTDDEFIFCHWCLYWSYQFTLCLHGQLVLNLIGVSHCLETFATNTYLPLPPSLHQLYCCITLDYLNLFHL